MQQDRQTVADTVDRACTAGAGTVQALADEVGVSYAALCSWSRGRRQPPAHRLRKLADVLDARSGRLREIAGELRAQADAKANGGVAEGAAADGDAANGDVAERRIGRDLHVHADGAHQSGARREPESAATGAAAARSGSGGARAAAGHRSSPVPLRVETGADSGSTSPSTAQRQQADDARRLARRWADSAREQARKQREASLLP